MTDTREEPSKAGGTGESGFHRLQPERDLELNWEVDLAQKLESYLLQICSGEFHPGEDESHIAVNFAEAALLLQGSIQVYSRKVEYLYSLVLRALEFLSHKRQQDHLEGPSVQDEDSSSHKIADDENDQFWVSEDIQVETRNIIENTKEDAWLHQSVKPPANLVVLEGDCLDAIGDGGELDSYMLATTSDIYQDFILLDPSDAEAVQDFLKGGNKFGQGQNGVCRGSSTRKSFQSPSRRSGGNRQKLSVGKNQGGNVIQSPLADCRFNDDYCNAVPDPPFCDNFCYGNNESDMDAGYSKPRDECDSDDDDADPWKPLNPHEPGNLKIKPFRKVKAFKKNYSDSSRHESISALFPLAKLHGTISPEFASIFELRKHAFETQKESNYPLLYEKLRNALSDDGHGNPYTSFDIEDDNDDNGRDDGIPDFDVPYNGASNNDCMDEAVNFENEKPDPAAHFDTGEPEHPISHASLEDLCRSHLDALLASIAESEKQTEMATRVSTWKQKVEHNLEEQDAHPPFDIQEYGKSILEELSGEASKEGVMSFSDVVKGQEKYNVARSFSALLQLVNNGDVELDKSGVDGESICYSAMNPFHVRLVRHDKQLEKTRDQMSRKRSTSPAKSGKGSCDNELHINNKSSHVNITLKDSKMRDVSQQNRKFLVKPGKVGSLRCTPEGKRRRRSRLVESVD